MPNLEDYTKADLKVWIDSLILAPGAKTKAKAAIDEFGINGKSLVDVESKSNLIDLGFPRFVCQKLFDALIQIPKGTDNNDNNNNAQQAEDTEEALRKLYAKQRKEREQQQNTGNPSPNTNNSQEFKINYDYGTVNGTTKRSFTEQNYVADVETAIIDEAIGGNTKSIQLLSKGNVLNSKHTLKQIGLTKETSQYWQLSVSFRVDGGASLSNDEKSEYYQDENRTRLPNFEGEKRIKPTLEADCIMGYDSRKTLRVKMPCSHVFDPITLFRIAKMTMENHSKTEFICPVEKCKTLWPFEVVAAAADMNEKECINFSQILSNRKAIESGEFKKCKGCQSLVKKPQNLKMKRVRCSNRKNCNLGDFCWLCLESWKGGGFIACGNKTCQSHKINEALSLAPMIIPSGREDKCPNLRACPRCWVLVRYRSACKHMPCWNCRKKFCFMCLSLQKDDNTWDCVGGDWHTGQCPSADPQILK